MKLFNFAASPVMFIIRANHCDTIEGHADKFRSPKAYGGSCMAGVRRP